MGPVVLVSRSVRPWQSLHLYGGNNSYTSKMILTRCLSIFLSVFSEIMTFLICASLLGFSGIFFTIFLAFRGGLTPSPPHTPQPVSHNVNLEYVVEKSQQQSSIKVSCAHTVVLYNMYTHPAT